MKKDTREQLKRSRIGALSLVGEGVLVGAIAGMVVTLYRLALEYADELRGFVIHQAKGHPGTMALWFVILAALATLVYLLLKFEPLIGGSGIPQLEGEITGALEQSWWRVVLAKFAGGLLSMFGGLALGREGPSIQLGAMMGKGTGTILKSSQSRKRFLMTCGASAGLSAAFHAPLAGVLFSLEEVHKNFSVSLLIGVMSSSLTADFLTSLILGEKVVFQIPLTRMISYHEYGYILLLGIVLGVAGAFYNWFTLKCQDFYQRLSFLPGVVKVMLPFALAGVLAFTMPQLLGSGHGLIDALTSKEMALTAMVGILLGRFIFSGLSFGAGVPGGIFFPLLVIGGFIGGVFAKSASLTLGLDPIYLNNFVVLAMAGYFAAIVRAPLTGIILLFEMTGSLGQMLSLSVVSIVAYVVATLLGSEPIYESLLERLLHKRSKENAQVTVKPGEKVISIYAVEADSFLDGATIKDILWPENTLVVSVQRGNNDIIPSGDTLLVVGDQLMVMTTKEGQLEADTKMRKLCACV
ncbi:H+/Cl- antiporter ClcA [Lachnospiraceae bacterium PM6-15]|uniref:ClC family H(+)/Cl(-) exchange transporter n=1 Tax=Ohessyouella blattaphilus TaxID=2949333 RepID=UPI003E25194B